MRIQLATIVLAIAVSHAHTAAQSASASVRKEQTKVLVHVTPSRQGEVREEGVEPVARDGQRLS